MKKKLKVVGGSLLAAWMALNPTPTLAQENIEGPISITQNRGSYKKEAWIQAGEFAKENPAVGIAVYGRPDDGSSEQVAQMIKGYFSKNGIKSEYFLSDEDKIGFNVGLYLKDVQFGPDNLKGTIKNIKTIIQNFPEAWPDYQMPIERPAEQTGGSYQ